MSLICLTTIATGILISKGILFFNLAEPMLRYGTAVLFSYGVFFALIYFWLRIHFGSDREASNESVLDIIDTMDVGDVGAHKAISEGIWRGQGGQFSGGGASSSWVSSNEEAISSATESTRLKSVVDFADFDEGVVIIVVFIAVLAAIIGSAGYLIYQAPEILFEAAFEVILAAGLVKQAKKMQSEGWFYSIFKRTWWLCAIVLVLAMTFGFVIKNQCPEASSFAQYRESCWNKSKD
jgi:hypothetical protein